MTTLDNQNRDWLDDRIEAYLDGDLKPGDSRRFDEIALMDEELARELNLARSICQPWLQCRTKAAPKKSRAA